MKNAFPDNENETAFEAFNIIFEYTKTWKNKNQKVKYLNVELGPSSTHKYKINQLAYT